MTGQTILLAEDDASIRLVASQTLSSAGFTVRATASVDALERWVREGQGDVVVSDVYLGDTEIFERLSSLRLARPELPFIIMSAQNTILTAASAADHGAFDYLPKPFDIDDLVDSVTRALKSAAPAERLSPNRRKTDTDLQLPLIGRSETMQEVYRTITRVMNTDLTILIQGEPGTGKDLAARAIHDLSARQTGQFQLVYSAGFDDRMAEALERQPPATLYVDEVGDLSLSAQARLIGLMPRIPETRLIASTRQSLSRKVESGDFRDDLYYRLSVVRVNMPALRKRKDDVPELAGAMLQRAAHQGLPEKSLDSGAIDLLVAYDWPGNVRELENVIYRLCALSSDATISSRDVERELRAASYAELPRDASLEDEIEDLLRRHVLTEMMGAGAEEGSRIYQSVIDRVERPLLKIALQVTSGNKVKAAALLGLNRNTLRAKINSLGIGND